MDILVRRIYHLLKSGSVLIGIEHFLVMFPSAILIAKLSNSPYGPIVELSTILLVCGIGTLFFSCFGKLPLFLGPSFAYIGFVSYQVSQINDAQSLVEVRSTVLWGYIIAGVYLLLLCFLYQFTKIKTLIATLFPNTVMGPAISLIGLELASTAMQDSGFIDGDSIQKLLAVITLVVIIVASLVRQHFLQNASVLLGILVGCIVAVILDVGNVPQLVNGPLVALPGLSSKSVICLPTNMLALSIAVFPSALIAFAESLGRVEVYDGMMRRDSEKYDTIQTANKVLLYHALSNLGTSSLGIMPNAIYAENLALMNLHNSELSQNSKIVYDDDGFVNNCYSPYSTYPYILASILCIVVACIKNIQDIFMAIPMPVLGGMELFVFGLITAPGIQILVEQQVNYKKVANQVITASVLLAGISGLSITVGTLTLRGMSLGLVIGVAVNLITILLRWLGWLRESFTLIEIIDECFLQYNPKTSIKITILGDQSPFVAELMQVEWKEQIKSKEMIARICAAKVILLETQVTNKKVQLKQDNGCITLSLNIGAKFKNRFRNDHANIIMSSPGDGSTQFIINEYMSKFVLQQLLKEAISTEK